VLEEDLGTECHVSDTSAGTDQSPGGGVGAEVVEGAEWSISKKTILHAVVGTIEDVEGICLNTKRNALRKHCVLVNVEIYVVEGVSAEQVTARSRIGRVPASCAAY
jgi:hypothetical protein